MCWVGDKTNHDCFRLSVSTVVVGPLISWLVGDILHVCLSYNYSGCSRSWSCQTASDKMGLRQMSGWLEKRFHGQSSGCARTICTLHESCYGNAEICRRRRALSIHKGSSGRISWRHSFVGNDRNETGILVHSHSWCTVCCPNTFIRLSYVIWK